MDDMLPTAENIVSGLFGTLDFAKGVDLAPDYSRILNSKKVTDHHAERLGVVKGLFGGVAVKPVCFPLQGR